MKFCLVSKELDGAVIAHELVREGHDVYVWSPTKEKMLPGLQGVHRVPGDLKGFIARNKTAPFIFDGHEWGPLQTSMRKAGMSVIGSGIVGNKIEEDRMVGIKLAKQLGVRVPETNTVESLDEAIKWIRQHPGRYILKQNGNLPKTLNWGGEFEDGSDLIGHLEACRTRYGQSLDGNIVLQKYIKGTNLGVAAWFNGKDWLRTRNGIIKEVNVQHKNLLNGGHGPVTGEQGTSMILIDTPHQIFNEFLDPLTEVLRKSYYVGCVDADVIVNEDGTFLCEWTMRMGYPATSTYNIFTRHNLTGFFNSLLSGGVYEGMVLNKKAVVVVVAFPTFPYQETKDEKDSFLDEPIYFNLTPDEMDAVGYYEMGFQNGVKYIDSPFGYAFTVSTFGDTFAQANQNALRIIEKVTPAKKSLYRTDIGMDSDERLKAFLPGA